MAEEGEQERLCVLHSLNVCPDTSEPLQELTERQYVTIKKFTNDWKARKKEPELTVAKGLASIISWPYEVAKDNANLLHHRTCYRRYTDTQKLRRYDPVSDAKQSHKRKRHGTGQPGPDDTKRSRNSSGVLPKLCLFCGSVKRWVRKRGVRVRENLSLAETLTAGKLYETAMKKNDDDILIHLRDKDCVALEVRYHKSCFRDYCTPKKEKPNQPADEEVVSLIGSTDISSSPSDTGMLTGQLHTSETPIAQLFHTARIINESIKTSGDFYSSWPPRENDCTKEASERFVPPTLFNLLAMMTESIEDNEVPQMDEFIKVRDDIGVRLLAIAQDIMYVHGKGRKLTPKSLALGVAVKNITGNRRVLSLLNKFGHSASRYTVSRVETSLGHLALNASVPTGVLCKVPTTITWDNIDFQNETATGAGTAHYTNGIIIQKECLSTEAFTVPKSPSNTLSKVSRRERAIQGCSKSLPIFHRLERRGPNLQPVVENLKDLASKQAESCFRNAKAADSAFCMAHAAEVQPPLDLSWTSFNKKVNSEALPKSVISYLPMIDAPSTEMTTVNALLLKSLKMANTLSLGHIVLVFDLAIYAKAQEIRWRSEELLNRLVVRLGEFHTSMNFMGMIGKRFGAGGLQDILIEAGVIAIGSVNGVVSGHHYNRAIRCHKVVFRAMSQLRFASYLRSLQDDEREETLEVMKTLKAASCIEGEFGNLLDAGLVKKVMEGLDEFVKNQSERNPTFQFWSSYIDLIHLLLAFIRATRTSDWELHLTTVRLMIPWFFAYDRANYARYLPIYWLEMSELPRTHPGCHLEMMSPGNFTVQRQSGNPFSSVACDLAIEQTVNKDCKTSGGMNNFSLNIDAAQKWLLSHAERAAITKNCETMANCYSSFLQEKVDTSETKMVNSVISTVTAMIDPFSTDQHSLVSISSGAVADEKTQLDLLSAEDLGEQAADEFITKRLVKKEVDFYQPVRQMKLRNFGICRTKKTSSLKLESLKSDRNLFARLLAVARDQKVDMQEVLTYCLGPVAYPLASAAGTMAKTSKAALLTLLEKDVKDKKHLLKDIPTQNATSALLIDGMAFIQSMKVTSGSTFLSLATSSFYRLGALSASYRSSRVDFITDTYPSNSIKSCERRQRAAAGIQNIQIYGGDQKIPNQWKKFINSGKNKEALVEFFFSAWQKMKPAEAKFSELYITHGEACHVIKFECDLTPEVLPVHQLYSDQEEADTRLLLHARHASPAHPHIILHSPDTDVVIIALSLTSDVPSDILIATGTAGSTRLISVATLRNQVGHSLCDALPGFHAFTGCDSVSAFYGKGKKVGLQLLKGNSQWLKAFQSVGLTSSLIDDIVADLEHFVCSLYGCPTIKHVNEARYKLFHTTSPTEQSLPPTQDSLIQHIKRANYQAHIWRQALTAKTNVPSPIGNGWEMVGDEISFTWMTKPPSPGNTLQLTYCKCAKTNCEKGRCSCKKMNLSCSDFCFCTNCGNMGDNCEKWKRQEDDPDSDEDNSVN